MWKLPSRLFVLLLILVNTPALSEAESSAANLLPVEQAFQLTATATTPNQVSLHWDIADGYYLYRNRIKAKTLQSDVTLGELVLPPGKQKHDAYLGDVEVYYQALDATLPYTLANPQIATLAITLTVQGCHEREPQICYPPYPVTLTLALPKLITATNTSSSGFKFGGNGGLKDAQDGMPLPPEQAFVFEAIAGSPTEILARWSMPKGYYLYRDKTLISLSKGEAVTLESPRWPKGVAHKDEHFGSVQVYFDQVELPIPLKRTQNGAQTISLNSEFQGCQDNGVCYPVMTRSVDVALPAMSTSDVLNAELGKAETVAPGQSAEQILAARLGDSRLLALLSFFGFGLLLAFTPCVFPMIPILSGIIAGAGERISSGRAFTLSLVYVLASSVIFTIAGVAAGLVGTNVQAAFQKPWILWSFASLFVLLSLSMFGLYELQLPNRWQSKFADLSNRQRSGSLIGVAVMGMLSALIVGPCVAPPLAAAVLYISQTHDPVFGGLALLILSLGMGTPLVIFGTAAGKLLPRAGAWMEAVKAVFGVVFLGLAIWMLSRILEPMWILLMSGALLIGSAVYLGALERLSEGASGWSKCCKALGVLLLVWGVAELVGAAAGSRDILQPLKGLAASSGPGMAAQQATLPFRIVKNVADFDRELSMASESGKPVMLDFYADWCVSCKEMEASTFAMPTVHKVLSDFVLLKADVTANDEAAQGLLKRFGLFGPPATLFFGPQGQEQRAIRLIGFEAADSFVQRVGQEISCSAAQTC